jgi:hypothetical protein
MAPTATIEHRHAQNLSQFLGLHYRYGRGAMWITTNKSIR